MNFVTPGVTHGFQETFPVNNDCRELFQWMSQQSRSWRCCSAAASSGLYAWSSLCLDPRWGSPWPLVFQVDSSHRCHSGRAELTQMLPCSDWAQMPEACETCLEYFTGCALWTRWEAHVCHCSGISSPFLFCTPKENLLHNKPADWHDSSTGTCFSVPGDIGRPSRRAQSFSRGAGVPLDVRAWARSRAVLVQTATLKDSQHL